MLYFNPDDLNKLGQQAVRSKYPVYLSENQISSLAKEVLQGIEPLIAPDSMEGAPAKLFDIFLSYNSLDLIMVLGLYQTLTVKYNKKVYIDCIGDPQLNTSVVSRGTAEILRRRMAQSETLFCATTQNTPKSDWVPWELGFEDGFNGKVAILPITRQTHFGRQSYFELYPEVQPGTTDLLIYDRGILLGNWQFWVKMPRTI